MKKAHENYQKNINKQISKKPATIPIESNYFGYSGKTHQFKENRSIRDEASPRGTEGDQDGAGKSDHAMNMANEVMKKAMNFMINQIEEKVSLISGDLIEPLELYVNHHEKTS